MEDDAQRAAARRQIQWCILGAIFAAAVFIGAAYSIFTGEVDCSRGSALEQEMCL